MASFYFYMTWNAKYIVIILLCILINYFLAIQISKNEDRKKRRFFLGLCLIASLSILFVFKYFNFFTESLGEFLKLGGIKFSSITLNVLLPVGISFYTFQALSYTIDVYKKKIQPEKNLFMLALYIAFFPQLVAGPIERASNLLTQLYNRNYFDYVRVTNGLKLMLWGFFKKMVIADRLAIVVNAVYNNPTSYTGTPLILATFFFAFQIYCDFSGYTDIAIGAAQVFGIRLMENFRRPYYSKSVAEFWKRWHISLSTWFEDYVFTPIYFGISKRIKILDSKRKHQISFFMSSFIGLALLGLWHGANWTFVLFGMYYGILIPLYYFTRNYWDWMNKYLRICLTFVIVSFGWILFRANSIKDAVYITTHLFTGIRLNIAGIALGNISREGMIVAFASILFMEFVHLLQEHWGMRQFLSTKPVWVRWTVYLAIILSILLFGVFKEVPFIYFQF